MISKLVTVAALAMPLAQAMPATLEVREDKIVGGEPASLGEFPFLVALTQGGGIHCGGSLVNANTVITAAHCSDVSPSDMTVVVGTVDLGSPGQEIGVESIIVHPDYTDAFTGHDIAVWKLSSSVEENANVGFVSLPAAGSDLTAGTSVTVAGWGRLSGGGELPEIQQKVTLPAVSRDDCSTEFGTTITDTMVCAGATGVGACNGDSGGPLVDGSGTLVGTVSWGSGACNSLSVFGNVGALVDFLEANI